VVGSCKYGDEPAGSCATELVGGGGGGGVHFVHVDGVRLCL
jgi:hypothetical protein